jgi:hypothetical protein
MTTHRDTVPLPLALHLAGYAVIGLFCAFAGPLNLIDPTKIFWNGVIFLTVCGFSWGYVFGIFMGRPEALALGFLASGAATGAAGWMWGQGNLLLTALFGVVGLYGFVTLRVYRRWVLGMH